MPASSRSCGEETPVAGGETYRVEESVDPVDPGNVLLRDRWRQDKSGLFNYRRAVTFPDGDAPDREPACARRSLACLADRARARGGRGEARASRAAFRARSPGADRSRPRSRSCATRSTRTHRGTGARASMSGISKSGRISRRRRVRSTRPACASTCRASSGPNDIVQSWWAAPGESQRHYHIFADLTDETGQVTGTFEADEVFVVTSYQP